MEPEQNKAKGTGWIVFKTGEVQKVEGVGTHIPGWDPSIHKHFSFDEERAVRLGVEEEKRGRA